MKKIETSLAALRDDIRSFYKEDKHHFIVMNGVDLGTKMELQWFFSDYAHPCEVTMFYTATDYTETIPSIGEIVKSAWATEAEFTDLMGMNVENTKKGFVLDLDSEQAPLRKNK